MFDVHNLVGLLLRCKWHRECEITVVKRDGRPYECFVYWHDPDKPERRLGLRHSAGPSQGFFWDMYGDDMQSPELALIGLSKAMHPAHYTTTNREIPWPKHE